MLIVLIKIVCTSVRGSSSFVSDVYFGRIRILEENRRTAAAQLLTNEKKANHGYHKKGAYQCTENTHT